MELIDQSLLLPECVQMLGNQGAGILVLLGECISWGLASAATIRNALLADAYSVIRDNARRGKLKMQTATRTAQHFRNRAIC